jgi:hypothetical protein
MFGLVVTVERACIWRCQVIVDARDTVKVSDITSWNELLKSL